MRSVFALLCIIAMITPIGMNGCEQRSSSYRTSSQTQKWYEGGTLHKSNMREWSAASYRNRLATSSDFAAHMLKERGTPPKSMDELKVYAVLLEGNMSEANADGLANIDQVSYIAATIWILMEELGDI